MKFREISLAVIVIIALSLNIYTERVISLSPSITEILFELGLGDLVVGNTKFCNFPPQSNSIKKIGGYLDINMELIIELQPDVIFHYPEHFQRLKKLSGITKLVQVSHKNISDLLSSIKTISMELKSETEGKVLITSLKSKLDMIRNRKKNSLRKKILIIIGRDPGQLRNITIIGYGDFLNEVMSISDGENAYKGKISYPSVSIESIIKMDPDIIIEFSFLEQAPSEDFVISLWEKFPLIRAVRLGNIQIIKDDYWVRPGPRITKIAKSLYEMLHTEKSH